MKKVWGHKARSYQEAAAFDLAYYFGMSSADRLAIVQYLRENSFRFRKELNGKYRKRLRRVSKIIKQA